MVNRRIVAALVLGLVLGTGFVLFATDGPLTPFDNLRGRTDENGYLLVSSAAAGATAGPLTPMANIRTRTDENGYLRVALAGAGVLDTLSLTAASNQIIFDSDGAATGTLSWTPSTSSKTITLPNLTGHVPLQSAAQTVVGTVLFPFVYGGNAANEDLTLEGTSHATKTTSYVVLQPTAGNVGVNITAPDAPLHIGTTSAGTSLSLHANGSGANLNLIKVDNTGGISYFGANNSAGNGITGGLAYSSIVGSGGATSLQLITNSAAKMTIESGGNIGMGTTSPDALLDLSKLALTTTSTDGLVLQNETAALVGTQVQISPRIRLRGYGWDADDVVSRSVSFFTEALPVAGNTVSGTWKLGFIDPVSAALTYPFNVTSAGVIQPLGGYDAVDGTDGLTQTCAAAVVALTIKNGLVTAVTCP